MSLQLCAVALLFLLSLRAITLLRIIVSCTATMRFSSNCILGLIAKYFSSVK